MYLLHEARFELKAVGKTSTSGDLVRPPLEPILIADKAAPKAIIPRSEIDEASVLEKDRNRKETCNSVFRRVVSLLLRIVWLFAVASLAVVVVLVNRDSLNQPSINSLMLPR
ncbi:hypothetical protein C8R45DRAFT_933409 [Mycena sanguinolenta]|nr:hypothetical protein C8R45DRAFT_933409 [Mycena sanguinolenta]